MSQAEGPVPSGRGAAIVKLLEARAGQGTIVRLHNGEDLYTANSAWGRDIGEEWEHLYLNASPDSPGLPICFVRTSDVMEVRDAVTNEVLHARADHSEGRNDP